MDTNKPDFGDDTPGKKVDPPEEDVSINPIEYSFNPLQDGSFYYMHERDISLVCGDTHQDQTEPIYFEVRQGGRVLARIDQSMLQELMYLDKVARERQHLWSAPGAEAFPVCLSCGRVHQAGTLCQ